MNAVYRLTLRQLAGKWRLLIMTVLSLLPVLTTLVVVRAEHSATVREFEAVVLSSMLAAAITPLVVLAIAAAAFGNELEDRTLANITLSPIRRWQIALPKFLAVLTVASPLMVASAFATSWLAFLGDWTAVVAITAATLLAVALYGAAFTWLGLVSAQAVGLGLLYIVLWEGFFSGFVEGVRLLSIRHYAIALMHGLDPRRFSTIDHLPLVAAVAIAAVILGGFLLLTVRKLHRMDVP